MEWDTTEKYKKKAAVEMQAVVKEILTILAIEHDMEYAPVPAFTILKNYIDRYTRPVPYKELGYTNFREMIEDIPVIEEDPHCPKHYRLSRNYWTGVGKKERLPKRVEKNDWDWNLRCLRKCREALAQWDDNEWIEWNKQTTPVMSQDDSPTMTRVHAWLENSPAEAKSPSPHEDEDWTVVSETLSNSQSSSSPFSHVSRPRGEAEPNVMKPKINQIW